MLPYLFVLLAIAVRFLPFIGPLNFSPHAWGFTPIAASLLFFGAKRPRRQMWIPLVMLAVTDVILTKVVYAYVLSWDHFVTWAWYAAILLLGTTLRNNSGAVRVVLTALASSVSFFLISNFATWAAWPEMYPRSVGGLMAAYVAGIPFFPKAAEGDMFFTVAMFSVPVFMQALARWSDRSGDHIAAA